MNQEQLRIAMEYEGLLPEDVLTEILVYLSVKSLIRFRCVSKYWCALIRNPIFVSRQLKYDCKKTVLLKRYLPPQNRENIRQGGDDVLSFHEPNSPDVLVSPNLFIPYLKDLVCHEYVNLFGPCNGLICISNNDTVILCNPALREFELLPQTPFACPEGYIALFLGSGFGFDVNSNSYKYVQMWDVVEIKAEDSDEDPYIRVDLYNVNTNSWKLIDALVPETWHNPGFHLLFNDSCHWQASDYNEEPPLKGVALSFNVCSEVFKLFDFPHCHDDGKHPTLVVLNQCFTVVRFADWMDEPHLIDIWVMKEYGVRESWIKELVIGPYLFKTIFLSLQDEWLLVENRDNQLASSALQVNETKKYQFYGVEECFRALIFTESLISLNQVITSCVAQTTV